MSLVSTNQSLQPLQDCSPPQDSFLLQDPFNNRHKDGKKSSYLCKKRPTSSLEGEMPKIFPGEDTKWMS